MISDRCLGFLPFHIHSMHRSIGYRTPSKTAIDSEIVPEKKCPITISMKPIMAMMKVKTIQYITISGLWLLGFPGPLDSFMSRILDTAGQSRQPPTPDGRCRFATLQCQWPVFDLSGVLDLVPFRQCHQPLSIITAKCRSCSGWGLHAGAPPWLNDTLVLWEKSVAAARPCARLGANREVAHEFTYVSTAGGAFLEWMEGKPLPGVEVLKPSN